MGKAAVAIRSNAAKRRGLGSPARAHQTGRAMARRTLIALAAAGLEEGDLRRG